MKQKWIVGLMLVWIYKSFGSIGDLVGFLNKLPPESAAGSKVPILSGGKYPDTYYIIFQTDHPEQYR
jgi:hypothetical protein